MTFSDRAYKERVQATRPAQEIRALTGASRAAVEAFQLSMQNLESTSKSSMDSLQRTVTVLATAVQELTQKVNLLQSGRANDNQNLNKNGVGGAVIPGSDAPEDGGSNAPPQNGKLIVVLSFFH